VIGNEALSKRGELLRGKTFRLRDLPFITFTRREGGGQAQVDACGLGGGQSHVVIHTEN